MTISVLENVVSNFCVQTPLDRMTSAVILQTTMVSIKGSSIETMPCSTDFFVLEDAWAIGEDPWPASLEYKPLATPYFKLIAKLAPKNPPTAAEPVKTCANIALNEGIIFW